MIPTITAFAEALEHGDRQFATLRNIRVEKPAGRCGMSRTYMLAEAVVTIGTERYLLCAPLTREAAAMAERAAEEIRRSRCTFLTEYRMLHNELEFRNSAGQTGHCDVLLHRLPQGESLDKAVTHIATRDIEAAFARLGGEMRAAGFVHGNLKPSNLIFGDDGRLHPIRYSYSHTAAAPEEVEAEIAAIGEYIGRQQYIPAIGEVPTSDTTMATGSRTPEFDEIDPPHDMMRRIRVGRLYGYADTEGNTVIEPQYTYAENFHENRAVVETADGAGVIDREGNRIIATRYDMAERDEESGRFIVRDGSEWIVFDYFGRETTRYRKEKSKTYEYGKC